MTQEDSVKDCCNEKTVGNITYTLFPGLPDMYTHPKSSKDGCIYTVKGDPSGKKFAFKHGQLPVECKAEEKIENSVIFEENGEKFEQKNIYRPDIDELVIAVPAHSNYPDTKFIMQGRSSKSPAAGKMIVSTGNKCSLEDIPDEINPEDMKVKNRREKDIRQMEEVKKYRIRSNIKIATKEELEMLTDTMKNECEGKMVEVSTIETVNEEEFGAISNLANFANNLTRSFERVKGNEIDKSQKNSRVACTDIYYGCATVGAAHCVRWTFEPEKHPGRQPLHFIGTEKYCINCCPQENTPFLLCSCITNTQKFSTAYAISAYRNGATDYECIASSYFSKWDSNLQFTECKSTTKGGCKDCDTC